MNPGRRKAGGVMLGSTAGLICALLAGPVLAASLEIQVSRQDGGLAIWAEDPILGQIGALLRNGQGNVVDLGGSASALEGLAGRTMSVERLLRRLYPGRSFVIVYDEETSAADLDRLIMVKRSHLSAAARGWRGPGRSSFAGAAYDRIFQPNSDRSQADNALDALAQRAALAADEPAMAGQQTAGPQDEAQVQMLSSQGARLDGLLIDGPDGAVERQVVLNGDLPLETYVTAHGPGQRPLQRSAAGDWLPWDGDLESLSDNGFEAEGDSLTFALAGGEVSHQTFPVTYTLAYKTESGFKFGVFDAMPAAPAPTQ